MGLIALFLLGKPQKEEAGLMKRQTHSNWILHIVVITVALCTMLTFIATPVLADDDDDNGDLCSALGLGNKNAIHAALTAALVAAQVANNGGAG